MSNEYPREISFNKKLNKTLMEYRCGWCGLIFKRYIGQHYSNNEVTGSAKKQNGSDQVQCICQNFLKTWPEDKK